MTTPYQVVDLAEPASEAAATAWWTTLTAAGGEGAVVKPLTFVATGSRGLLQPAVEVPRAGVPADHLRPGVHAARAPGSGCASVGCLGKRSLALREFALGIEGLERFVQREPLRRVHECVFGVLALESEPVDPRL